nr:MAG TPA: hypothetical protein [Caudoviricetes sp.]
MERVLSILSINLYKTNEFNLKRSTFDPTNKNSPGF